MNAFTSTMRDSVWTEGKPQSPPQHLSSMVAAMFVCCRDQEMGDVKKKYIQIVYFYDKQD